MFLVNEDPSLIFMVFFLPLSIYLFYLSSINRASHARVVTGVWDIAGMLGALSGFLLIGGPAILSGLYEQWRMSWLLGNFQRLQEIRGTWNEWIMLYAAYFVGVVCLTTWLLLQARNKTSIYNVEEGELELALRRSLDESNIVWERVGDHQLVLYGARGRDSAGEVQRSSTVSNSSVSTDRTLSGTSVLSEKTNASGLFWRPFQALHHVALNWTNVDRDIRESIEDRLANHLNRVASPANHAAAWFFTAGLMLMLFSFFTLGVLILFRVLRIGV